MPSRDPTDSPGRLGAFTLLGAAAGSVPLPWIPAALVRRVRGAMVQDLVTRHGLSLSPEARVLLAEPARRAKPPGATRDAMIFFAVRAVRRYGPMRAMPPLRTALDTFVLGRLFARYLSRRSGRGPRIEEDEAAEVRHKIDSALVRALTAQVPGDELALTHHPAEELRDEITQMVDGALIATAGFPVWLVGHLDAAFDELLAGR